MRREMRQNGTVPVARTVAYFLSKTRSKSTVNVCVYKNNCDKSPAAIFVIPVDQATGGLQLIVGPILRYPSRMSTGAVSTS